MAQPATNPKIEELRFRVKTDPKSRLFYQLAEELRKVKAYDEAEQVLHAGLTHNATYLAAWVSLGRTLREEDKHQESIEAFTKALQLDPGNVVAARLMADAYLDLGDKIEAIKKYKLVRALLPVDEELNAQIDRLEDEINPVTIHAAEPEPATERTMPGVVPTPPAAQAPAPAPAPVVETPREVQTADEEPMHEAHEESPFEDPVQSYTSDAVELEQPAGMHIEAAPVVADMPAPWPDEEPAADVFEPAAAEPAAPASDDVADTVTMADLYVQQGFVDRAQSIYESILDRDPNNDVVRAKLDGLDASRAKPVTSSMSNTKVDRLEKWLSKVKGAEAGRV